ncbi:MAG: dockerin type I repeat-containing protein [Actinomycetota bacterium]
MRAASRIILAVVLCVFAQSAHAQFATPLESTVRERISGLFVITEGGPTPAEGDQIGVFFQDSVIGVFDFTSDSLEYVVDVFGDSPTTEDNIEGPITGQQISFRFYDQSTNNTINLDVLNAQGEAFNITFQGQEVPSEIINTFPDLADVLIPSRVFDVRAAGTSSGNGGDGNGGDGGGGEPTPSGNPDVNADGNVNALDAALVLRIVVGSSSVTSAEIGRADVNGDGTVSTQDAIAILRLSN